MANDSAQRPNVTATSVGKAELALSYPAGGLGELPNAWLMLFAALLALPVLASFVVDGNSGGQLGWDLRVNCAAVDAYVGGLDPYVIDNLKNTTFAYPYLPVTLDIFRPLCSAGLIVDHHRAVYLVLAILCGLLLPGLGAPRAGLRDTFLRVLCALGAFVGFEWTLASGNFSILTGLLTAVALALLLGRSPLEDDETSFMLRVLGAAVLGLVTSFKLVFCPVLASLYFLPQPRFRKLILIAVALGMFILPILMSMVFYADLFASWLRAISGQIPGQLGVAQDRMNPSLFILVQGLAKHWGLAGSQAIVFALYGLAAVTLVLTPFALSVSRAIADRASPETGWLATRLDRWLIDHPGEAARITVLAMYALYLCSPRLKEYAFFELAIYAAVLIVDLPAMAIVAVLTVAILIPTSVSISGGAIEGGFLQLVAALLCFWIFLADFRKCYRP
ncbi:hypothetical protein [Bradyrhizobium iriomotense]|uniref:DUF2029 domain-containing protein n=1 Tax=Bradyrhizobium iriomotense TaxID=441950 RepID=A0ABQ6B9J5_9BRAD|nr:hypothetical protein [Bradyrhizobium iriomotense]GLR89331.1 hypothetical protein GCM10007857_60440 [Bradyrhizobium iriomotense]